MCSAPDSRDFDNVCGRLSPRFCFVQKLPVAKRKREYETNERSFVCFVPFRLFRILSSATAGQSLWEHP
jgi:hypothetical protein